MPLPLAQCRQLAVSRQMPSSSLDTGAKASGGSPPGSLPRSADLAARRARARPGTAAIAACRQRGCWPADCPGRTSENHVERSTPSAPASAMVGTSGETASRFWVGDREHTSASRWGGGTWTESGVRRRRDVAADQVLHHGRGALIGDVLDLEPLRKPEQLADHAGGVARCCRTGLAGFARAAARTFSMLSKPALTEPTRAIAPPSAAVIGVKSLLGVVGQLLRS